MDEHKRLYEIVTAYAPGMPIGAGTPVAEVQSDPVYVLAKDVVLALAWWTRQPSRPNERVISITEVRPFAIA